MTVQPPWQGPFPSAHPTGAELPGLSPLMLAAAAGDLPCVAALVEALGSFTTVGPESMEVFYGALWFNMVVGQY